MSKPQESETPSTVYPLSNLLPDLRAGIVVFLVAVPLCLGIAQASGVPQTALISGLIAGLIGGIVVGALSGSHTSVSGPAAGLTAIVSAQIGILGFEKFLVAVIIGGILQIFLGWLNAGALSAFFPSSVIKGLLAAIGVILILKQIPHLVGHDKDPEGEMSFSQSVELAADGTAHEAAHSHTTFSEISSVFSGDIHVGAAIIGIACLVLVVAWGRIKFLKNSIIPGPLIVVLVGVGMYVYFKSNGWKLDTSHLVYIPDDVSLSNLGALFNYPDFSALTSFAVYRAGATIAIVASLETLLNLEAVDKLDPENRHSPPSRELVAQGVGNICAGMIGGLPMTSVIVRSSVNVSIGAKTKVSAIFHGVLIVVAIVILPTYMNMIPKAALAAILIATGFKLASPQVFREMARQGIYQLIPFVVTLVAIVVTDLLIGILIGLGVSVLFILISNLRRPVRRIVETHLDGEVLHVELSDQVSFLNRAAIHNLLHEAKSGTHLLIDASQSDYIDPDVLTLIRDFKDNIAPSRDVRVRLRGFREQYRLNNEVEFADYSTRELQDRVTPEQVLDILREGNRRFRTGHRLTRDISRQVGATAKGQNPLAVVLSGIDSRVPVELVFDLGIGDIFSVRVAGNVIGNQPLASIEYGVAVSGVKLVLVLGQTRCGAVTSSVELLAGNEDVQRATGCAHLHSIVDEIERCVDQSEFSQFNDMTSDEKDAFVDYVARQNVLRTVEEITKRSEAVRRALDAHQLLVVGALYDVKTGEIEFLLDNQQNPSGAPSHSPSPTA